MCHHYPLFITVYILKWAKPQFALYCFMLVFIIILGEWTSPTVTGDRPPPIHSFTLLSMSHNTSVLFGGDIGNFKYSNDVYIIEFTEALVVSVL